MCYRFGLSYIQRSLDRKLNTFGRVMAAKVAPRTLSDYLLSHGRPIVTLSEVAELTGLTKAAASVALIRLRESAQMFSPHPGLYVAVPPQYRTWGVVPGIDFIDAMMKAMSRRYYVALLSAAELHGAAHQRPQVFQVMVDRPVGNRDLRRVRLRFYTHANISEVPIQLRNTATGQVPIGTPAATCLDLVSRPNEAGGLNNVATVIADLASESKVDGDGILHAVGAYPAASLRRLGWLLDHLETDIDTDILNARLDHGSNRRATTLLDPTGPRRGHADHRWGVIENTVVEPDL